MIPVSAGGVEWHVEWRGSANKPVLALVHGFAGSLRTWERLRPFLESHFFLLMLDLPGHGGTPIPDKRDFSLADLWRALEELLRGSCPTPPLLCGYSLGGRIALHIAVHDPALLRGVILLGASPGIDIKQEREARRQSDGNLAEEILNRGSAWFADYWSRLPLFASQKKLSADIQTALHAVRAQCDPCGLAYALQRFGTGRQDYLGNELFRISCPLLLLAGALDEKFCASNLIIEEKCGASIVRRREIADAGHATHIEQPEAVAKEIVEFVNVL